MRRERAIETCHLWELSGSICIFQAWFINSTSNPVKFVFSLIFHLIVSKKYGHIHILDSKRSVVEKSFFEILIPFNYIQDSFENVKGNFF